MNFYSGKVGFAVGTGRCGTQFLARVLAQEPGVSAVHERNPVNETFHRYCNWYQLPVDSEGFLHTKELEINQDLEENYFSFESSAHLSLSILELHSRFEPKYILLVRSPERVVNSYFRKGIFEEPVIRKDPDLALGYQDLSSIHHFFGRIVPSGETYLEWSRMTRVGKLSWWWNEINAAVIQQFGQIPESNWRIVKLEELNYDRYLELADFLGVESKLGESLYLQISSRRPNALRNVPTISGWSEIEIKEFERQVQPMAEKLGYEYHVSQLHIPQEAKSSIRKTPGSLRQRVFKILNRAAKVVHEWSTQFLDKTGR